MKIKLSQHHDCISFIIFQYFLELYGFMKFAFLSKTHKNLKSLFHSSMVIYYISTWLKQTGSKMRCDLDLADTALRLSLCVT